MSLVSVIRGTYPKLEDNDALALFHKKFWGTSMNDEETEWKKTQIQTGGQPEDEDQDWDEAMEEDQAKAKGKAKAMDEGGDEVMNESEGEATDDDEGEATDDDEGEAADDDEGEATDDDDDDILPGCYVLDISIPDMWPKSLWIRADYIRIFDFFQAHYDEFAIPMNRMPSGVLTGQPGVGKSLWIYYAARRLLAEMRPFIWFYGGDYYLFVDDGVYELPSELVHRAFRRIMWTLVDSDQGSGIPEKLVAHGTRLFVVYATSPAVGRWSRLNKTTRRLVVIMNPWSRREIQRITHLSPLKEITETSVNEIFDELGPVPRLCIDHVSRELAEYRQELHEAISKITTDHIQKLIDKASVLAMDAVSHKICLLSRQDRDDVHSRAVVAPITNSIKSRLSNQFRNLQRAEQIRLYQLFEKVPGGRRTAGIFYEAIAQNRLQEGMSLEIVPMVKLEERNRSKTRPRWYSSHILIHNTSLEVARRQMLRQKAVKVKVNIKPTKTLEYTDNGLRSIKPNVFYVPALDNQKALDSFILLGGFLYIFQMTIASSHDINQGLIGVANEYHFPPMDKWRFVLIIPPNLTLSVSQPWKLHLRNLSPFSAVVSVDEAEASNKKRKRS